MKLEIQSYAEQSERWPDEGRHILAHFDENSIIVYQAYKPSIGDYAIKHGKFGGDFSYLRMSWVKPNFLWMMYRCGWAAKKDQEVVLGLRISTSFFDQIVEQAVPSTFSPEEYETREEWQKAVQNSDVRLQWDPDHNPQGHKLTRKAIQLGMRGGVLEQYGQQEIIEVIDMTGFVKEQRVYFSDNEKLKTPIERVYASSH